MIKVFTIVFDIPDGGKTPTAQEIGEAIYKHIDPVAAKGTKYVVHFNDTPK